MKKPVLFSKYIGAVSKEVLGEDLIKPHPVMIELECLYRDCLEEIKSKLNSLDVSNGVVIIVLLLLFPSQEFLRLEEQK